MKHPFPKQGKESSREANLKSIKMRQLFSIEVQKIDWNIYKSGLPVTNQEETKCWLKMNQAERRVFLFLFAIKTLTANTTEGIVNQS